MRLESFITRLLSRLNIRDPPDPQRCAPLSSRSHSSSRDIVVSLLLRERLKSQEGQVATLRSLYYLLLPLFGETVTQESVVRSLDRISRATRCSREILQLRAASRGTATVPASTGCGSVLLRMEPMSRTSGRRFYPISKAIHEWELVRRRTPAIAGLEMASIPLRFVLVVEKVLLDVLVQVVLS
jgi:hypothetical protein